MENYWPVTTSCQVAWHCLLMTIGSESFHKAVTRLTIRYGSVVIGSTDKTRYVWWFLHLCMLCYHTTAQSSRGYDGRS